MAGEDPTYVAFVHTLPCAARKLRGWPCQGPLEADHAGKRGVGQRAHDDTCIPLCRFHHRARTDLKRPFLDMTKEERAAWVELAIAATRYAWAKAKAREGRGTNETRCGTVPGMEGT